MIPDQFDGKKILLGVTGGIAAYKSALLIRELVSRGAEVKVIMTPSALEFITPLTLSTLSGNPVIVNTFPASQKEGVDLQTWHIEYSLWADLFIIAPATLNTIAKIVHGFADNALTTVALAGRAPMLVAPAADMDMYNNPVTLKNFELLRSYGAFIVEAEEGFLASGLKGPGRMAGIDKILDAAELVLSRIKKDLTGRKILVTAGPTFEDIDPVRFIGNRSSGKMGYEIAKAAFLRGAEVTLISGPTAETAYPEIGLIKIRSAADMKIAVESELQKNEILIMSAAVADYKPANPSVVKIKKEKNLGSIELAKTDDILAALKKEGRIIAGFALETDDEEKNALRKLESKGLDLIVLNSLREEGAGFEHSTNKIKIFFKGGDVKEFPLLTKFQTANQILTEISLLKKV